MGKKMVQKLTHFMEIPISDIHKKCAELKVKSHSLDNMNKLTVALKINPTKQGKRKLAGIVFAHTYNMKRQELREIQNSNNDDGDEESETEAAKEPADVKKTKASKK